jgi:hypothetical protein
MARILPDTPPRSASSEVVKVYQSLKRLPDDFEVWHNMGFQKQKTPDFLLVRQRCALLVMVSAATANDAQFASQSSFLQEQKAPMGKPEEEVLLAFMASLGFLDHRHVGSVVLFPHISGEQLKKSGTANKPPSGIHWVGRDPLQADSDRNWENLLPPDPLDDLLLEKLRQRFNPEIVIPEDMTVRPKDERRRKAGLTDYLLDYDQEWAVKSDLDISPEGQNVSSDLRLNIINGVAGSGKTLILLYRLRILHRYFPDKRFLVLTHNKPLSHDLKSRYNRIEGGLPENIEWATFQGWCHAHWPKDLKWIKPLSINQREKLVRQAWERHLKDSSVTYPMFLSELDWFKDQPPMSRADYLTTARRGRGFGLTAEQRERVFAAMLAYQKSLGEGKRDWWDIPRLVWKAMQDVDYKFPSYDFVLIDEAQFFAPLWIQIVLKTLASGSSHLFIVADPTQGFMGRGTSWKSLGLDARGRTHLMRRSYRTTREILSFASLLYRQRLADEKDDDILVPDLLDMPGGAFPEVIPLTSPQDEIARTANEVADFVKQGLPRQHLLLLHPSGEGVKALVQAIEDRLGKGSAMDPKQTYPGDYVRVTTLNAGAGLESPIVFLVGVREMFEQEQSLRLSDSEREALVRDNTRKLYMAATRAGQRLVITFVGELPEVIKSLLFSKPEVR